MSDDEIEVPDPNKQAEEVNHNVHSSSHAVDQK